MKECECCGFETNDVKRVSSEPPADVQECDLCMVCRNTRAGNGYIYRGHYGDAFLVMRMLAWCTNAIIKEIRKAKA